MGYLWIATQVLPTDSPTHLQACLPDAPWPVPPLHQLPSSGSPALRYGRAQHHVYRSSTPEDKQVFQHLLQHPGSHSILTDSCRVTVCRHVPVDCQQMMRHLKKDIEGVPSNIVEEHLRAARTEQHPTIEAMEVRPYRIHTRQGTTGRSLCLPVQLLFVHLHFPYLLSPGSIGQPVRQACHDTAPREIVGQHSRCPIVALIASPPAASSALVYYKASVHTDVATTLCDRHLQHRNACDQKQRSAGLHVFCNNNPLIHCMVR